MAGKWNATSWVMEFDSRELACLISLVLMLSCRRLSGYLFHAMRRRFQKWGLLAVIQQKTAVLSTGGPSSSCKMIILRNKSHGVIIRVCMGIFKTALRNKKYSQILNKNATLYFRSASLANWPLTMSKRTHFGGLSISRFTACIRKAQGCTRSIRQN